MSSIFDVSLSSDSEDDGDYVPTGEVAHSESSSAENCSDDEDPNPKRAKKKKAKPDEQESEIEVKAKEPAPDAMKRADDIWKSFLSEVERNSSTQTSADSGLTESPLESQPDQSESEVPNEPITTSSTHVYEYAGEVVTVQESFTIDSGYDPSAGTGASPVEPPKPQVGASAANPKKRAGIGSVLGTLMNKKQKMTTLQKTLYDWKTFKKDEGIEEDLEKFNKGRGGFIERQRFLQRSDVRSYEAEKSVRQSRKNK